MKADSTEIATSSGWGISVKVDPPAPTERDDIEITVAGDLPNPCYEVISSHAISGNVVYITVEAIPSDVDVCVQIVWSFSITEEIGRLPASVYRVEATVHSPDCCFCNPFPCVEVTTFEVRAVATIDIKPGSVPNSINPAGMGTIPVAVLSSPDFDAPNEVDKASLTFGSTGDEESLANCAKSAEDVNGDGLLDQVCHFRTEDTGFQCGDMEGILRGQTVDGVPIEGRDSVRIVRCRWH